MAEKPLAYWLALVDRLVEERFSAALEEHGVTRVQWRVLGVLDEGSATRGRLDAALADVAPDPDAGSTETGELEEVAELVESGWIVRAEAAAYSLTEKGRAAHDRLAEVVAGLRATLTDGLTDAEIAGALSALERMARNLGWSEDAAPRV